MKKGFMKEMLFLCFAYFLVHCFVALISNNPSPDYDMWLELNIYEIISVHTYFSIALIINIVAFLYGMWLNKKKRILNFIFVNIANSLLYCISYVLLNTQLERIIDTQSIIIIARGLGYTTIFSLSVILFLLCVTNVPKIIKHSKKIIIKNKESLKEEINNIKKRD